MSGDSDRRYPDAQEKYCQIVGRLLPTIVGIVLSDLGFRVWINKDQSNGVDLKVFDKGNNLVLVAEILNWSLFSRMSEKRKNWIVCNLSEFSCNRVLIYSTLQNEQILDDLCLYHISLLKIGYQVLPKSYYEHYVKKDQAICRRLDNEETRKEIRSKIVFFMHSLSVLKTSKTLYEEVAPQIFNIIL